MIGMTLKGYQIVEKIKDGSVGTIYKVKGRDGKIYALKMLSLRFVTMERKRQQFKKEAEIAKKLNHPRVIKVHEYFDEKPQPFFVMEYFESENLKFTMWHLPNRVYGKEFFILRQIAEALEYLHRKGIVHRDIKPENILVNRNSEIKLIDFSIALTWFDRINPFAKARIEGTPLYMSPEQIMGKKVDHKADIYSFGALTYEVITKRPPFIGTTERSIFEKHINRPPAPMKLYVRTISDELDNVVQKMLIKKADERLQSITEVIYYISKWERKETVVRKKQVSEPRTWGT